MAAKKKSLSPRAPTSAPPLSSTRSSGRAEDATSRASGVMFSDEETTDPAPTVAPAMVTATSPAPSASILTTMGDEPGTGAGRAVPAAWMERLLALGSELPVERGDDAVVRAMIDALSEMLPRCGVGACFVSGGPETNTPEVRQQVIRRHPAHDDGRDRGVDPTRLFPGYAHEIVVEIPGDAAGSTLHAASDDAAFLASDGAAAQLLRRAARVLRRALDHAHTCRAARSARGEVNALNAQMVQAEKLASLGQIAAGMVHELNNPLTSIVAYTDYLTKRWLAKREHADPDELERLRRIGESAHRLLRFTRDLVTYARPSGDVPIPVVIHGVVDQALVFCEHVLAEARTRVERRFGDGILPVRGLPEQLTQVFVNLVTNACHAMGPGGGTIVITTELVDHDRRVRVTVADTGSGILPEHLPRVFAPFFTTKSDGRGTGLGLAIVKSIVETHDGHIDVESDPPNGTSFILTLPVHQHHMR